MWLPTVMGFMRLFIRLQYNLSGRQTRVSPTMRLGQFRVPQIVWSMVLDPA